LTWAQPLSFNYGDCDAEFEAAGHRRLLRRGAGVKKIKRFIPMDTPVGDIIHVTAKTIKIMKQFHKAPKNNF
jgi:hypothetical protein